METYNIESSKKNVATGRLLILVRHSENCLKIERVRLLFNFSRKAANIDKVRAALEVEGIMDGCTEI
jgi:hypothetical protein